MNIATINFFRKIYYRPFEAASIAPLAVFRVLFGAAMAGGVIRFAALGWIHEQYVAPKVHFAYFGFEWIPKAHDYLMMRTNGWSVYVIFGVMLLSTLGVMAGAWYRLSAATFFICFTFIELIDKTYYLNHYYFVSLVALLLCFVPAGDAFSLDAARNPARQKHEVPRWTIDILKFQLGIVYVYAGLAKINAEWLFQAMPLRIWLPANDAVPLIGSLFREVWVAYMFSWIGMLYDVTIVLWLTLPRTRLWAYLTVVVFHALTGILFQIGMFPVVMIALTPIFFSVAFHERFINGISTILRASERLFGRFSTGTATPQASASLFAARAASAGLETSRGRRAWTLAFLGAYCAFQVLFPWRFALYDGNMFWTEEGYRFGWRVMLMEKAATATFYVRDGETGREGAVINSDFLNAHQEKQMAMQPDMILQFAHILRDYYAGQGMREPRVRVEAYATLNARPSRLLIDSSRNLAEERESFRQKSFVAPLQEGL
jgi:hypothetical protein